MEIIVSPVFAEYTIWFLILAFILGFYLTWGVGANDISNALGTAVGSGAITPKQGVLIAAFFEFAGAVLAGGTVTGTLQSGILNLQAPGTTPELFLLGLLAALLATSIWISLATNRGWPVSTTHAIVSALVGFGIFGLGTYAIHWPNLRLIAASWIISPLVGALLAFALMRNVQGLVLDSRHPLASAKKWGPLYVFLAGYVVALVTLAKGLGSLAINLSHGQSQVGALVIGIGCAGIAMVLNSRVKVTEMAERDFQFASVERIFTPLMIFTACAMAYAHGANDVGNGIGPLAAILSLHQPAATAASPIVVPPLLLLAGAAAILAGVITSGYKTIKAIGAKMPELTSTRGFCATLASAVTVLTASGLGLPVSTTHIAVGAVVGVGLARGISALDLRVLLSILVSWFITLPIAAFLAAVLYFVLSLFLG